MTKRRRGPRAQWLASARRGGATRGRAGRRRPGGGTGPGCVAWMCVCRDGCMRACVCVGTYPNQTHPATHYPPSCLLLRPSTSCIHYTLQVDESGRTRLYCVPYSEHSSFPELQAYVRALKPKCVRALGMRFCIARNLLTWHGGWFHVLLYMCVCLLLSSNPSECVRAYPY